jgi:hypothetical protein
MNDELEKFSLLGKQLEITLNYLFIEIYRGSLTNKK